MSSRQWVVAAVLIGTAAWFGHGVLSRLDAAARAARDGNREVAARLDRLERQGVPSSARSPLAPPVAAAACEPSSAALARTGMPGRAELEPEPPTEEQVARAEDALDLIDDAIAAGEWTTADADALRAMLPELGPLEFERVALVLVRSINENRLAVATGGAPL